MPQTWTQLSLAVKFFDAQLLCLRPDWWLWGAVFFSRFDVSRVTVTGPTCATTEVS